MQTKTGIILLHKDKFELYSPYLPNILQFQFVPELIQDFDLVNRELLENLIRVFLLNNKVPASNMMIILADDASFLKDFIGTPVPPQNPTTPAPVVADPLVTPPTLEDLQNQANLYLDHVPFENVASRTFPLANGIRAYATNQDIYEALKFVFEKHGFIVEFVIPGFAFGQEVSAKPFLDGAMVTFILQKLNTLGEYNLLKQTITDAEMTFAEEIDEKESTPTSDKDKRRMIIAAVGGILLLVLLTAGILYWQFSTPPYKAPPAAVVPPVSTVVISPNPTAIPTTVPAVPSIVDVATLTVQIVSSAQSAQQAQALQTTLRPYGFKSIVLQTQDTVAAQTILIFSSRVSASTKITLTQEVKKTFPNVLVQEKADAPFDIVITLGR